MGCLSKNYVKTFDEELNGRTLAVGLREGSPLGLSDDERVKTLEGRAVGRSVSLFEGCGHCGRGKISDLF